MTHVPLYEMYWAASHKCGTERNYNVVVWHDENEEKELNFDL